MKRPLAVRTSHITKVFQYSFFRKQVGILTDFSWDIEQGQIAALLGPNGSGKSTLLRILLGLLTPTSGRAELFGIPCHQIKAREQVGFLPERPTFPLFLNAREVLTFYGKLSQVPVLSSKIEEVLALVSLDNKAHHPIQTYSQGMLQRLGLAQALLHDPALLILDEPTTGLDPFGLDFLGNLFLELKKSGKTILFTSHLLTHTEEICDQVAIIAKGRLLYSGAFQATKALPSPLEKLYFASCVPLLLNPKSAGTRFEHF